MAISDLAPELLDVILARLPLRDAARASVLSVAWGRSWRHLSDLDFTSRGCDSREAIDGVLLHHAGPVRSVRVKITDGLLPGVHGWIEALSQQRLQSLDLTFRAPSVPLPLMQGPVPDCIFGCRALKDIVFTSCVLPAVPASFTGFPSLTKLRIDCSSFHKGSDLELMISMSQKLEELTMSVVLVTECEWKVQELRMESSSLRFLEIYGHVNITWVGARLPRMAHANFVDASPGSVLNLLRGMESSLEKLVYYCNFSPIELPKRIPSSYENLKRLRVTLKFNYAANISFTIYLMRSARNLTQVVIEDATRESSEGSPYGWDRGSYDMCPNLQFLHMFHIIPQCNELAFMRLVLSKARMLRMVEIGIRKKRLNQHIQEEICRYDRASPRAQIHFIH